MIGPFGPSGRFEFSGDAATFNEVLKLYAQVAQPVHILYLTTEPRPLADAERWSYQLSISHEGQGFIHLRVRGAVDLESIKLPAQIRAESLAAVSVPIDATSRKQQDEAQRAIDELVRRRHQS